jgi:Domain of unknown function (DUF3850)
MPHIHYLKTWPLEFRHTKQGDKTFDIRWNDRGYRVEDIVVLREYDPVTGQHSGDQLVMRVRYMVKGPMFDLPSDLCVLGLEPVPAGQAEQLDIDKVPTRR